MALKGVLVGKVKEAFADQWEVRDGRTVPVSDSLKLSNEAVKLDGVVLYADMVGSTLLVDYHPDFFAAEIYKSYLYCAARIIHSEGGEITSYDGDRIMAVFIGDGMHTKAARAALKINHAVVEIINPLLKVHYQSLQYELKHTVAIDTSALFVARTGIRGSNDLVWIGKAANHAAKLAAEPQCESIWITKEVYDKLLPELKFTQGNSMWEVYTWNTMSRSVYRSTWHWKIP